MKLKTTDYSFSLLAIILQNVVLFFRMFMQGIDMDESDYDGRTALHVAAAEGHLHCVKFLLEIVGVQVLRLPIIVLTSCLKSLVCRYCDYECFSGSFNLILLSC